MQVKGQSLICTLSTADRLGGNRGVSLYSRQEGLLLLLLLLQAFAGDAAGEVMHQQLSQVPGSYAILATLVQKVLEQLQEAPQQQPAGSIFSAALPVLLRQYLHSPGRQAVSVSL
jgi:hypothetical protein